VSAGYSGTPLPRKLGIKEGSVVAIVSAPDGFDVTLGAVPEGATLRSGSRGKRDITIWFTRSATDLERRFDAMARTVGDGTLWVAWPKKSSELASPGLTEDSIRDLALDRGLVDTKVCAIDEDWSGLRLTRRRT
jgi:hypothetical protein